MKLTEVQAQYLLLILRDSLNLNIRNVFSVDFEQRAKLLNEIMNQQSQELVDLEKE